jgi:hypothetical protein
MGPDAAIKKDDPDRGRPHEAASGEPHSILALRAPMAMRDPRNRNLLGFTSEETRRGRDEGTQSRRDGVEKVEC